MKVIHRALTQVFWGFFALVSAMAGPGWTWHLHTEIIRTTLDKKDKLKQMQSEGKWPPKSVEETEKIIGKKKLIIFGE